MRCGCVLTRKARLCYARHTPVITTSERFCISVDFVLLPTLNAAWLASSVADRTTARYTVRIGLGKNECPSDTKRILVTRMRASEEISRKQRQLSLDCAPNKGFVSRAGTVDRRSTVTQPELSLCIGFAPKRPESFEQATEKPIAVSGTIKAAAHSRGGGRSAGKGS